uniref:Glutathione S-transferase C-terminal domain-containing protein n=1 Tax=Phallusia mammillata TaxID=59560 RepID=A0A6F9DDJ1_9ASCI|nr:glutathione S-transferase C-terminal domain-containing protein-like [Phallusia mammillata]
MNVDTVYLDKELVNNGSMYSYATQTVLLVAAYCDEVDLDLCLVTQESEDKPKITPGFKEPEKCFSNVTSKSIDEIPKQVADCHLPVILMHNQTYVVSGLCHVIRQIIKLACKKQDPSLKTLLGHKQCCLKASSEVSSRTKLCEVTAPHVVDKWMELDSASHAHKLPAAIIELESILKRPVVIHNMDKCQRVVLERINKHGSETQGEPPAKVIKHSSGKKVVKTQDLPPLQHTFIEGVDFALSDLALLPLVHNFLYFYLKITDDLLEHVPLTIKWYHRLQSIPKLSTALRSCNVDFVSVKESFNGKTPVFEDGKCQVLELGEKQQVQPNKKALEKTLRRDLPVIIEKLNQHVDAKFKELNSTEIKIDWDLIPKDVHPTMGELSTARAQRKCHQMENIIHAAKQICKNGDVIVDFCCGGGHVGILLSHFFPKCQIILIENKEESLDRARARIENLGATNITIYQCNLEHYRGKFDIGVALHACGVATDMVLHECMKRKSSFVISPCCYGRIVNTDKITYPQSKFFKNIPTSFDEMLVLGRGGDQTSWNFENGKAKQGKHCMAIMDTDRINAASDQGYKTELYSLQPQNCSPKNNLIVGVFIS